MEYYQYFRLKAPPFQPASPDGAVYFSATHLEGLHTLEAGFNDELSGLTLLTGEAGMGKTTLIYSLLQRDYRRVRIAHIDDPKLSFLEMMRSILAQLNLYSPGATKLDYINTLDHLLQLHGSDERIAIVVDESQLLSDDVLEELRLLSNRGQTKDRRLRLILVGQPELAERLKQPHLRQLNQRIASRSVLKPLTYDEMVKYVECRLSVQGSSGPAIFDRGALHHLYKRCDGIPRKINMLCQNAMIAAFYAGERKVSAKTAKKVAAEYHDAVHIKRPGFRLRSQAMVAVVGVLALVIIILVGIVYPSGRLDWLIKPPRVGTVEWESQHPESQRHLKSADKHGVKSHRGETAKPKTVSSVVANPAARQNPSETAVAIASKTDAVPTAATTGRNVIPAASGPALEKPAAPAVTPPPQEPAKPERQDQITVREGDTLEKIAVRYFGSTSAIQRLERVNPQLTNINELTVGEVIHLPAGVSVDASRDDAIAARPDSSPSR